MWIAPLSWASGQSLLAKGFATSVLMALLTLSWGASPPIVLTALASVLALAMLGLVVARSLVGPLGHRSGLPQCREVLGGEPLVWMSLSLFAWLSLSVLWSVGPVQEIVESWSRYRRWAYVVLLSLGLVLLLARTSAKWCDDFYDRAWKFFFWGLVFNAAVAWAIYAGLFQALFGLRADRVHVIDWLGLFQFSLPAASNPSFGQSHISVSTFLVIGATGLVHRYFRYQQLLALIGAMFLGLTVLLLQSRTGYLLLGIALVLWLWHWWSRRRQTGSRAFLIALAIAVALATPLADQVRHRAAEAVSDVTNYVGRSDAVAQTSQAIRIDFWRSSLEMPQGSDWLVGVGVGGYAQAYRGLHGREPLDGSGQPHSEYLAMLTQGGLIGLSLWLAILLRAYWLSRRYGLGFESHALLLVAVSGLFNSIMWNREEGHFLALLLALLASRAGLWALKGREQGMG